MKNLNLCMFLLSLTSSVSAASHQSSLSISGVENNQSSPQRASAASVTSYTPSEGSYATSSGGSISNAIVKDISSKSIEDLQTLYLILANEHKQVLKERKSNNKTATKYLIDQINALDDVPGVIVQSAADEHANVTLQNGIANLVDMYKRLEARSHWLKPASESIKTSPDSNPSDQQGELKRERDALRVSLDDSVRELKAAIKRADDVDEQLQEQLKTNLQLRNEKSVLQRELGCRDQDISRLRAQNDELQSKLTLRELDLSQQSESSQSQSSAIAVQPLVRGASSQSSGTQRYTNGRQSLNIERPQAGTPQRGGGLFYCSIM